MRAPLALASTRRRVAATWILNPVNDDFMAVTDPVPCVVVVHSIPRPTFVAPPTPGAGGARRVSSHRFVDRVMSELVWVFAARRVDRIVESVDGHAYKNVRGFPLALLCFSFCLQRIGASLAEGSPDLRPSLSAKTSANCCSYDWEDLLGRILQHMAHSLPGRRIDEASDRLHALGNDVTEKALELLFGFQFHQVGREVHLLFFAEAAPLRGGGVTSGRSGLSTLEIAHCSLSFRT